MSPTIWGDHVIVICSDCRIESIANWQPEMRPRDEVVCWNCGGHVPTKHLVGKPGERVAIAPIVGGESPGAIDLDDVIAISDQHGFRLKRIVAIPGQTLSVREGVLFRDDLPIQSSAPWITVHHDSYRWDQQSWWHSTDSRWSKTANGFLFATDATTDTSSSQPGLLVYGHRSPYQGLRADQVRDDHAGNLTERRQLRSVDSLALLADAEVSQRTTMDLWNWTRGGVKHEQRLLEPGTHRLDIRWENSVVQEVSSGELSAEHPIGIRVKTGSAKLTNLVIQRPLLYWFDEDEHRTTRFPIRLGDDEYFVIGDNVPLSIDSRHKGPIKRTSIIGKVLPTAGH